MLRVPNYLWVSEDGMKMQGYNGSQCWDASFATQALAESDLGDDARFADCARRAWAYLERTQILSTEASQSSPAFRTRKHRTAGTRVKIEKSSSRIAAGGIRKQTEKVSRKRPM